MARPDGIYSHVIAGLKIGLPLVALAMLSTMFMLSSQREPATSVPFADALSGTETARQQVGAPYYAGTTDRGDILTMTARTARPEAEGVIRADQLEARLRLQSGGEILLDSAEATVRDDERKAHLQGGVRIESSQGYVVTTDAMISGLDSVEAETLGPVRGEGPLGTLEAGKMRIQPTEDGGDVQMLFTGGVKLVYRPRSEEKAAQ
ncbi:LPS export ABC transporter periplasmic protein LptC [Tropicibacter alexandrii]|uniref:LPS export ABC transporter periplasmic protein LptC n=1 Tax=Tropicibacter alexandrii TaxID=2267683 RepID=UPI000EF4753D|nr:LPS export ABC transporter periplasmic protein LptC [Tropicibacter alexandrii]